MPLQNVEWVQIKDARDLPNLEKKLQDSKPYNAFTEGKRDKNAKPIIFVGVTVPNDKRIQAHIAVWCKSEALEAAAISILQAFKLPS